MPTVSTAARMLLGLSPFRPAGQIVGPGELLAPLTLTRAQLAGVQSSATAVGGATLSLFGADVPRFSGTARRLLIEGQRTNAVLRSAEFDNASWTKTNGSITGTTASAPDGSASGDTFEPAASTAFHGCQQSVTVTASTPNIVSVWAKSAGAPFVQVVYDNGASVGGWVNVNLSTGAIMRGPEAAGGATGITGAVQAFGNGWYRISVGATHTGTTGRILVCPLPAGQNAASINPSVTTAATDAIIVWGAQIEAGAFASTYISTTNAAATRGADLVTATLVSLGIPASGACTVLWSGMIPQAAPSGVNQTIARLDDGTASNAFALRNEAGGSTVGVLRVVGGAASGNAVGTMTPGAPFRAGFAIDGAGRIAGSFNGGAAVALTGGPTSGLTTFALGNTLSGSQLFGETLALRVLPYTLSDTDLAAAVAAMPT